MKRASNTKKSNGKKVKKEVAEESKVKAVLHRESGESVFKTLLGSDISLQDFLDNYWEKKPLLIRRSENSSAEWLDYIKKLFSLDLLKEIIKEQKPIYELDINLCKLVKGKKQVFNKTGAVKLDHLEKAFDKDKVTIQFHQPQRFSDELWKLLEKLECYFQCLVGSNVYITPSDSQGLASHYDDIEAFVIQLEGSKHWLLYEPEIELPNTYSADLDAKSLKKPSHDIVLHTGDILYFPRGVIHQANTPANEKNSYSTHVTISTYQNFNKMELINSTIENAIKKSFLSNLELRRGLPMGFFRQGNFENIVQSALTNIKLEANTCAPKALLEDFMASRLPPCEVDSASSGVSVAYLGKIQANDKKMEFRFTHPEHMNALLATDENRDNSYEEDEEEEDGDESDEESDDTTPFTFLYYSTSNVREHHMMSKQESSPRCLKLKPEYHEIIKYLIEQGSNWSSIVKLEQKLGKTFDAAIFNDLLIPLAVENLIQINVG